VKKCRCFHLVSIIVCLWDLACFNFLLLDSTGIEGQAHDAWLANRWGANGV
jgi:hypothetical protein